MRGLALTLVVLIGASCAPATSGPGGGPRPRPDDPYPDPAPDGGTHPPPPIPEGGIVIAPGTDPGAPARFDGPADPGRAPEIVYPTSGVLVPPNLNELEIHFRPGAGNTLFEIAFDAPGLMLRVYTGCTPAGGGCIYTPGEDVWAILSGYARGRGNVSYLVRGTDASGSSVGSSAARTIAFAAEDIRGGIYYWNAEAGTVLRYDFGLRGQRPETFLDPARTGATECVGCHALSRDGSRIAVGLDEPEPSRMAIYDVATRRQLLAVGGPGPTLADGANFFSFGPDASRVTVSDGITISILDVATGRREASIAGVSNGTMPDWSPDGRRIVFADYPPETCGAWGDEECVWPYVLSGEIATLELAGTTWRRGPVLVPRSAANNFYPTFSPDGRWVLFNRSPTNALSYDAETWTARDHQLWVVSADGGAPIRLASAGSNAGDAWPKWDPTEYQHQGEPLFWISFASARPYGLRNPAGGRSQIWMAAFIPSRAEAGEDPVMPALWLPFQDASSGNHIAQWVTSIERMGCSDSASCAAGEFCSGGVCLPEPI